MSTKLSLMIWRNDRTAAQTIKQRYLVGAVFGTMVLSFTLGLCLMVIVAVLPFATIGHDYVTVLGPLLLAGSLNSVNALIVVCCSFLIAARKGYAGWLSTTLIGMVVYALVYIPLYDRDIHPLTLIFFGGAMALIFWMFMKLMCKHGLTPPQTTKITS